MPTTTKKPAQQLALPLDGGHDNGPLFKCRHQAKKPYSTRLPGTIRRRSERKATPGWVDKKDLHPWYRAARIFTALTGIRWSVEHEVPLKHPLVCGLHCPDNFSLVPLDENVRKGNRWWPDMPEQQQTL